MEGHATNNAQFEAKHSGPRAVNICSIKSFSQSITHSEFTGAINAGTVPANTNESNNNKRHNHSIFTSYLIQEEQVK